MILYIKQRRVNYTTSNSRPMLPILLICVLLVLLNIEQKQSTDQLSAYELDCSLFCFKHTQNCVHISAIAYIASWRFFRITFSSEHSKIHWLSNNFIWGKQYALRSYCINIEVTLQVERIKAQRESVTYTPHSIS